MKRMRVNEKREEIEAGRGKKGDEEKTDEHDERQRCEVEKDHPRIPETKEGNRIKHGEDAKGRTRESRRKGTTIKRIMETSTLRRLKTFFRRKKA